MEEVIRIKLDGSKERKIMAVKVKPEKEEDNTKVYHVPMPIIGDQFYINGVIFKITYQRDNPFRISAEPTSGVVLSVIEEIVSVEKNREELDKIVENKEEDGKAEPKADELNP